MNIAKLLSAFLAMSDAQRSYVEKLPADEVEGFFGKSAAERESIAKAALDADPVVYKTKSGIEIRKSQGDIAVMLAKQNDEQAEQLAKTNDAIGKANAAREDVELAKRSTETFGKATDAGKDVLRAIDGIADEKRRTAAHALVKGDAEAMTRLMKASDHKLREGFELPTNGAGNGTDNPAPAETPSDKLRKRVEKFQADNKIPTYQQALNRALRENAEIGELYAATKN